MERAGLWRLLTPKRSGGLEADFRTQVAASAILTKGDAAAGGCSSHQRACVRARLVSPQCQEEVYGPNPDVRIPRLRNRGRSINERSLSYYTTLKCVRRIPRPRRRQPMLENLVRFGIHAGPQNATFEELRRLWRFAEDRFFDWVSVWDHFYPILTPTDGPCFEAASTMTALAAETRNVRVGCLVFCMAYRHPAILANAAVTIDHISGGRLELGLGCGWHQAEFDAYGIPFLSIRERLDQLEEGAHVIRSLFEHGQTTFEGKHYRLHDAYCEPKPLQRRPRIWIGGIGEKRLLRIVARHADGWNAPLATPELYAQKSAVLDRWCETERRDPLSIQRSVTVGLLIAPSEDEATRKRNALRAELGASFARLEPSLLFGNPQQVLERLYKYERAGADWVMLSLRAPFDWDGYQLFAETVLPKFQGGW